MKGRGRKELTKEERIAKFPGSLKNGTDAERQRDVFEERKPRCPGRGKETIL